MNHPWTPNEREAHPSGPPERTDPCGAVLPICSVRSRSGESSDAGERARAASSLLTESGTAQRDRRRLQRSSSRQAKTGSSIAQHSVREFDRLSEFSCQLSVELNWNSGAEFPSGHSRLTDQVQPFGLRAPGDPTIRGIEQSHTYACCDQIFAKESDCMPTVHRTRL